MIYPIWRLSEYTPDNLGLAFTDDGLLLGRTALIERRDGRFVVREPSEIARLIKYSFPNGVSVDRLMPGLARVAAALNANDQALARIAAVHLKIPDLPSLAKRRAMIAEDVLIKYERDEGASLAVTGIRRSIRAPAHRPIPVGSRRSMMQRQVMANRDRASQKMLILHAARTRHRQTANRSGRRLAIPWMSQRLSPIGSARRNNRATANFGPPFGRLSRVGLKSRYPNMTLTAERS
jgi:hypothetical protein